MADQDNEDAVIHSSSNFRDVPDAYPGKRKAIDRTGSDESSLMDSERPTKRLHEVSPVTAKAGLQNKARGKRGLKRERERLAKVIDDLDVRDRNMLWSTWATIVDNSEFFLHVTLRR